MHRNPACAALLLLVPLFAGCAAETEEDVMTSGSGISTALHSATLRTNKQCEGGLMREVITIRIKNTADTKIDVNVEGQDGSGDSESLRIGQTATLTFYGDRGVDVESVTVTSTEKIRTPTIVSTRCTM
jgi:hypothetical protein